MISTKFRNKISLKLLALVGIFVLYFLFSNIAAPFGIFLFPFFLGAIPFMVRFVVQNKNVYFKSFISVLLVIISDILLRNCAGGIHDVVGNAWMVMFFEAGVLIFIFSGVALIVESDKNGKDKVVEIIFTVMFQALLVVTYHNYFYWYGLTREVYASSIQDAKSKGVLLEEYSIVKSTLIQEGDTITFYEAWLERKVIVNHKQLVKQENEAGILELKLKFRKNLTEEQSAVKVIDEKGSKSDYSYSSSIDIQYDSTIIYRDSIVLKVDYENIKGDILLVKKASYDKGE